MTKTNQIKSYLLLQGPHSAFFKKLGERLKSSGHLVKKVNFNGGDLFYWNGDDCVDFTEEYKAWEGFIKKLDEENNFTDLVLYGNCRYYHRKVMEYFKAKGKEIHVFEEGYLRPFWVTLEKDGVNNNSKIPRNKDFYDSFDEEVDTTQERIKPSLQKKIINTYIYYVFRSFYEVNRYPNYLPHRAKRPELEARGWLKKWITKKPNDFRNKWRQEKFLSENKEYFLLALQLSCDSQITHHSDFKDMQEVIDVTIKSFSKNAEENQYLAVKNHPEDNEIFNLEKYTKKVAKEFNIQDRVIFFNGGNMPAFLSKMKGFVTVNSTSGISALIHTKPVKCLGRGIYNFEGLADQQSLDDFWKNPVAPKEELVQKYRNYLIKETQINGNYYTDDGIEKILKNLGNKLS